MSIKLFILGFPGSGKSTTARHIVDYIGKRKSPCRTTRINDYDILYAMYKADKEGKFFRPAGRDGFNVIDPAKFDGALKTVEQEAKSAEGPDVIDPYILDSALKTAEQEASRAEQTTDNYVQAVFKPMLILIESARDDYSHALQQFSLGFLRDAYFLFLDARTEICKVRVQQRVAHPQTPDDHEVSDYIFDSYYAKESAHVLSANVMTDYGIEQQHIKVLDNNGSFEDIRGEVEGFVDTIVKHMAGKIHC